VDVHEHSTGFWSTSHCTLCTSGSTPAPIRPVVGSTRTAVDSSRYDAPRPCRTGGSTKPVESAADLRRTGAGVGPEVQNVQWLVDQNPVEWFMGRPLVLAPVLFPWAWTTSRPPTRNRTATTPPSTTTVTARLAATASTCRLSWPIRIARQPAMIAKAILTGRPGPRCSPALHLRGGARADSLPTTGNSNDYCVSRALLNPSRPRPCVLPGVRIDQAQDDRRMRKEASSRPPTQFPNIEREVHAAVLGSSARRSDPPKGD